MLKVNDSVELNLIPFILIILYPSNVIKLSDWLLVIVIFTSKFKFIGVVEYSFN